MTTQILKTKLYIPSTPPEFIPRPRLVERLDEGVHRKLTIVSAPAGFGKTTLLSEWLHASTLKGVWVSLDEGDNEPAVFWAYFIAGLQAMEEDLGKAALAMLAAPQPPPIDAVLTSLINEITEGLGEFALVLDDYHVIEAQPIHRALDFLLDHLPPQGHLVIAGRADPSLSMNRLRGRGQLNELRAADLRFTTEETAAFLSEAMNLDLSDEDVEALEERTEGWIASLQMAAISMQGREDIHDFVRAFSGSHRYILDYLTEEVLNGQPRDVQDFLLQTSILERMNGPLCDAVTGCRDGQEMLERLEADNLFVISLDDERRWYRYHRLFADLLRSRLSRSRPRALYELNHLASQWFGGEGLFEEAVHYALASDDLEKAAALMERSAGIMLSQSRISILRNWLSHLPGEVMERHPWLCVVQAWISFLSGDEDAVEPLLEMAESGMRLIQETPPDWAPYMDRNRIRRHITALRSFVARDRGDISLSIELSLSALKEMPPGDSMERSINCLNLGLAYMEDGELEEAGRYMEEARVSGQKAGNIFVALTAISHLTELQIIQGRLRDAADLSRQAIRLGTELGGGKPLPATAFSFVDLGEVLYEWNDLEGAERYVIQGIEMGDLTRAFHISVKGYFILARARSARGEREAAREALGKAKASAPDAVHTMAYIGGVPAWRARLSLYSGEMDPAGRWAESPECEVHLRDIPDFKLEIPYLTLVRVHIARGDAGEIPGLLRRVRRAAEAQGRMRCVIEVTVLQALALQELDKTEEALAALEEALSLAEPEGYVRTFVDEGEPMLELLRLARARGLAPGYAGRLLAAFQGAGVTEKPGTTEMEGTAGVSARPGSSTLFKPLSDRELEVLRLVADGLSNKEIAAELLLAVGTIKKHINNIFDKLGVNKRTRAVARAREIDLL